MKTTNLLSDNKHINLEDIRFFVVCAFVFSLPFDRMYSQLLIILLIVLVLIDLNIKRIKSVPKEFWIFQLVFLLSAIGMLYTSFIKEGAFLVERQLAIFIFPLLLPLSFDITEKKIKTLLDTLTVASIVSILYLLVENILIFMELGISVRAFIDSNIYFNHSFASPLNIHAGYLSMFVCLSILNLLKQFKAKKNKMVFIVQMFILVLGLVLLASRSNIIALALILLFLYPVFYVKKIKTFVLLVVALIIGLTFIFYYSPYLNNRFSSELLGDISITSGALEEESRIVRWEEGVKLISEAPFIGHGTGTEVPALQKKYWENGMIYSYYFEYNIHNQYLSVFIKNGLIGLLLFTGSLIFYFRLAVKNKSFIYLCFLTQLVVLFLTENVLDANKGIFYFAFFNTLFGFFCLKNISTDASAHIDNNTGV